MKKFYVLFMARDEKYHIIGPCNDPGLALEDRMLAIKICALRNKNPG